VRAVRGAVALLVLASPLALASSSMAAVVPGCHPMPGGYRCVTGPFSVEYGSNTYDPQPLVPPPVTGYITSAQATLVFQDGTPIPHHRVHLHHAVWANLAEQDMTCSSLPERFFATGKERTPVQLPSGHGYYWSREPPLIAPTFPPYWAVVAELDGGHRGEIVDAYVQLDIGFVEAPEGAMTNVEPVWLDVRNCLSEPVFDVPRRSKRPRFRERWSYTMPVGGELVALAGHLHDGGIKLTLTDVASGDPVFVSRARYEKRKRPWYLTRMTSFAGIPGKPVDAGDALLLTAVYDSRKRWPNVMGIMLGMLVPAP
jgi:hypothetical protein